MAVTDPNSDAASVYTLEVATPVLLPPKVVFVSNRRQCAGETVTYCIPDGTFVWGFNDVPQAIIQEAQDQLNALALAAAIAAFHPRQGASGVIIINDLDVASPYPDQISIPETPTFGSNIIPAGSLYNSGGSFEIGPVAGRLYKLTLGANDLDASQGGNQIVNGTTFISTSDPVVFDSQGLSGGIPVTASIQLVSNAVPGVIESVAVRLRGFSHTHPSDVWIGLTGPDDTTALLMISCGGASVVSGLDLTITDSASSNLPAGLITSGTYLPTNYAGVINNPFPSPAPQSGVWNADLSAFVGKNATGTWNLWVRDVQGVDVGTIDNGWELIIQTH